MASRHFDAVVVGLGGVGSFALRSLAQQAAGCSGSGRFLGLEQGSLWPSLSSSSAPSTAGHSSSGRTRIYRRAYFEHAHYVPWIEYSLKVFREMQETSGQSLMQECGTLLIEPVERVTDTTSMNMASSLPPLLAASYHSALQHGIPVEYLNAHDLQERYPQFHCPPSTTAEHQMVGLLEPGGGFLRPERIMKVALQDALSVMMADSKQDGSDDGVTVWDETKVLEWRQIPGSDRRIELHIQTNQGSSSPLDRIVQNVVTTDKLLVSMGAWTSRLIPSWKHMLFPVRQVQAWIDTSEAMKGHANTTASTAMGSHRNGTNPFSYRNMPTFVYLSPDWPEGLYGIPCDDSILFHNESQQPLKHNNQQGNEAATWLKVGIHKQIYADNFSFEDHNSVASSSEIQEILAAIPHCINTSALGRGSSGGTTTSAPAALSLIDTKPCLYTMTPDKHFVMGEAAPNVFVVAGLSGHGFKMTPALGHIMADYALGKDVSALWQTQFCSPQRFDLV